MHTGVRDQTQARLSAVNPDKTTPVTDTPCTGLAQGPCTEDLAAVTKCKATTWVLGPSD
jgi:hypothetical protein